MLAYRLRDVASAAFTLFKDPVQHAIAGCSAAVVPVAVTSLQVLPEDAPIEFVETCRKLLAKLGVPYGP